MRISDWSSDVCSSDLSGKISSDASPSIQADTDSSRDISVSAEDLTVDCMTAAPYQRRSASVSSRGRNRVAMASRSEEHTSELQSLMRISYAVFCLKKKKYKKTTRQI